MSPATSFASWVINEQKQLPEIDFMDLTARREMLTHARSQPTLMQVPLVPAYALTVRKEMNKCERTGRFVTAAHYIFAHSTFQHVYMCVFPTPSMKQRSTLLVHKTQAMSITHKVLGCLEGVFALGQVYAST